MFAVICYTCYFVHSFDGLVWFMELSHFQQYFSYIVSFIGGAPGENHRLLAIHRQTLSHNVVSSTPHHRQGSNSEL